MKAESGPVELQTSPKRSTIDSRIERGTRQLDNIGKAWAMSVTRPAASSSATRAVSIENNLPDQGGCQSRSGGGWSPTWSTGKEIRRSGHDDAKAARRPSAPGLVSLRS